MGWPGGVAILLKPPCVLPAEHSFPTSSLALLLSTSAEPWLRWGTPSATLCLWLLMDLYFIYSFAYVWC